MSRWHDDSLIRIDRISWILSPQHAAADDDVTVVPEEDPTLWVTKEEHSENWHVQVILLHYFCLFFFVVMSEFCILFFIFIIIF